VPQIYKSSRLLFERNDEMGTKMGREIENKKHLP